MAEREAASVTIDQDAAAASADEPEVKENGTNSNVHTAYLLH